MDNPKNLSEALCRIHKEVGVEILQNPDKLPAFLVDLAPNLKAERAQIDILIKSGCLKKLAETAGLKAEETKPIVNTAVDTLCNDYLMDAKKAKELCNTYVKALSGKTYTPPVKKDGGNQANGGGNSGKSGGGNGGKSNGSNSNGMKKPSNQFNLDIQEVGVVGQKVVVTGPVAAGSIHVNDKVSVVKKSGQKVFATVTKIDGNKTLMRITLDGVNAEDVESGGVLKFAARGSNSNGNGGGKSSGGKSGGSSSGGKNGQKKAAAPQPAPQPASNGGCGCGTILFILFILGVIGAILGTLQ